MPRTRPSRLSRSLGLLAALGVLSAHAAAFGWAVSAAGHVAVAGWFLTQGDYAQQAASLAGGRVSQSVEIVVSMPPAPPPTPAVEVVLEQPAPPIAASSRHPAPDNTMPLSDALAMARAGEASPTAPRRSVALAPQERFAHAPHLERQVEPSAAAQPTLATDQPARQTLPRSEPTHRPPAPVSVVSLPSTLGTEVDKSAEPIYNPPPVYPSAAIASRVEGRVVLRLTISAAGNVSQVTLDSSSGATILDQAAMDAVRQWRFRPALSGGVPVEWSCQLPVRFRLE